MPRSVKRAPVVVAVPSVPAWASDSDPLSCPRINQLPMNAHQVSTLDYTFFTNTSLAEALLDVLGNSTNIFADEVDEEVEAEIAREEIEIVEMEVRSHWKKESIFK